MRRATTLISGMAVLLMVASAPGWAHNEPGVDIAVTPSTGLTDGQSVQVSGSGYNASVVVQIDQCAASEASCILLGTTQSSASGVFSRTVNVSTTFTGDNGFVDCAVSGCIIHAYSSAGVGEGKSATEPIAFVPPGQGDGNGDEDGPSAPPELTCGGLTPTITGTSGNDVLIGTSGDDLIASGDGEDIVRGLGGNDIICGGDDADTLRGGLGKDSLFGEAGTDTLNGGRGTDRCSGGTAFDRAKKCEKVGSL
jgi:Ca2+-binding RTX toxin-like protein